MAFLFIFRKFAMMFTNIDMNPKVNTFESMSISGYAAYSEKLKAGSGIL